MRRGIHLLIGLLCPVALNAQVAGSVEEDFNPGETNGEIYAVAVQPDGKILLGGEFTVAGGEPRGRLARMHADGGLESTATFQTGTGANGRVNSIAIQPDGRILIAGDFTMVNGQPRGRIARLHADGTLESTATFNPGTGANAIVRSVVPQKDGRLLLTGDFATIDGQVRGRIARLHPNGSLEGTATFNAGTGADQMIHGAWVQADGRILVWGRFTNFNGQPRNRLARLTASGGLESAGAFNIGSAANNWMWSVAVQPDGAILAGGEFTSFNGQPRNRIARLNADGTLQSTALFNAGAGTDSTVRTIIVQTDGKIVIGGLFTTVDGQPRGRVARLHPNGSLEAAATFNSGAGADNNVSGMAVQPDGKIVLCGVFTDFDRELRNHAARLFNDPVTHSLAPVDRNKIRWLRGGGSAEVADVAFSFAPDANFNWTPAGPGARTAGGWELGGLNLPDTGYLRASGRTAGGYQNGSSGVIESVSPFAFALSPLAAWRVGHFGVSENSGEAADNADPDLDGLENLLEFAFGLDPLASGSGGIPSWEPSGDSYMLDFVSPEDVSGITYHAEYSATLTPGAWAGLTNSAVPPEYHFVIPAGTGGRLFVRWRITSP